MEQGSLVAIKVLKEDFVSNKLFVLTFQHF